jgi:hypothetical protein
MAVSEERDTLSKPIKVLDGEGRAADAASTVGRAKSAGETIVIVGAGECAVAFLATLQGRPHGCLALGSKSMCFGAGA